MTNIKRLLAATDLSAPARHAVERAALVSKETGASLDLLHVANFAPLERLQLMLKTPDELRQNVLNTASEKIGELADALLKRYGVSAGVHIESGSLLSELARKSEALMVDLIVFGGRGEGFMRHMLLGSTAERMLSQARCPMLVVKQVAHEAYRRILVPVDFSAASADAIRNAKAIAPNADMVLLHVFEVPFEGQLRYASVAEDTISHYRVIARQEATQKLHALSEEMGLHSRDARPIVLHGDPSLRILEQEQEQDCDLIVMGKHGAHKLEDLFLGSVTKRVLAESQGDILVSV
jgi:nucleotide-binding universal stress UspA family protein